MTWKINHFSLYVWRSTNDFSYLTWRRSHPIGYLHTMEFKLFQLPGVYTLVFLDIPGCHFANVVLHAGGVDSWRLSHLSNLVFSVVLLVLWLIDSFCVYQTSKSPWQPHLVRRWLPPWGSSSWPQWSCPTSSCKRAHSSRSPFHQIQGLIPGPEKILRLWLNFK